MKHIRGWKNTRLAEAPVSPPGGRRIGDACIVAAGGSRVPLEPNNLELVNNVGNGPVRVVPFTLLEINLFLFRIILAESWESLSKDKTRRAPSGPVVNDCIVSRIRPSPSYCRSYALSSPALIRGQQQPQPHTNVIFTGLECKMLWPSGGEEDGCHQPQLLLPVQGYCKSKLLVSRS